MMFSRRSTGFGLAGSLALVTLLATAATTSRVKAAAGDTFVVLDKGNAVKADAAAQITEAGGTLVYSYDAIGVAIARSGSPSFAASLLASGDVEGVSATQQFAIQLKDERVTAGGPLPDSLPAPGDDPFSSYQWDMAQIHAPEAGRSTAAARRWSSATSTPGSTTRIRTSRPTWTSRTASPASAECPTPGRRHGWT